MLPSHSFLFEEYKGPDGENVCRLILFELDYDVNDDGSPCKSVTDIIEGLSWTFLKQFTWSKRKHLFADKPAFEAAWKKADEAFRAPPVDPTNEIAEYLISNPSPKSIEDFFAAHPEAAKLYADFVKGGYLATQAKP